MQVTSRIAALALTILSGAQMSLAAPQVHTLHEREAGVDLVVQKFPDFNCEQALDENKFTLVPAPDQCVNELTNANSIKMLEQPSNTKICTVTTWSGGNCQGSNFTFAGTDECHSNLAFASFQVICSNIL